MLRRQTRGHGGLVEVLVAAAVVADRRLQPVSGCTDRCSVPGLGLVKSPAANIENTADRVQRQTRRLPPGW